MDKNLLLKIVNNKFITDDLCSDLILCFEKFDINTKLRQCHFLAQVLHESGNFKYNKEIASGQAYEFRTDLGNYNKGDGVKYKGRGYIQITGKKNYSEVSKFFDVDFINNPEKLEQSPYNMLAAGYYWNSRKINHFADKDDVVTVTRLINGGTNGLDDRKKWLEKCKAVLII